MHVLYRTSLLLILPMTLFACGRGSTRSVLQEIASTANDTLIRELEQGEEKPMREVLANKERYGLSDKEVQLLIENFGEEQLNQLVLDYIDPNGLKGEAQARWAYIPQVSDSDDSLRRIESVAKEGQIDIIDGTRSPELVRFPLITLSYPEKIQLSGPDHASLRLAGEPAAAVESSILIDSLRFSDVQEPWIKGAAELYMVISFVDKNGAGASELIELPSVDAANTDYELKQIAFLWNKSQYQFANIAFFEHDSGQNFSGLARAFTTAAAGVASAVINPTQTTTVAVANILNQLAGAVISALPPAAFTDGDDFVDQINTV
ncbi:MAG: DUF3103 family protein [Oligoflexus sp.]